MDEVPPGTAAYHLSMAVARPVDVAALVPEIAPLPQQTGTYKVPHYTRGLAIPVELRRN